MRVRPLFAVQSFGDVREILGWLVRGSLVTSLLLSSACAFKKDEPQPEAPAPIVVKLDEDNISREEFKIETIPLEPFQYEVRFTWPKRKVLVEIWKYDVYLNSVDATKTTDFSFVCTSRTRATYDFHINSPGLGKVGRHTFRIDCPVDVEINKDGALSDFLNEREPISRIFINNGVKLGLGGFFYDLDLLELEVRGSARFDIDSETRWKGTNGLRTFSIKAKKASGRLTVQLIGKNGEKGLDGILTSAYKSSGSAIPAASGGPGARAQVAQRCQKDPEAMTRICVEECAKEPGNGLPGQNGTIPGVAGLEGQPGLGTTPLNIQIEDAKDFSLSIELAPGLGGPGGWGSPGQQGGRGGAPGQTWSPCRSAQAGPSGESAPAGPQGPRGPHGRCGTITLSENLKDKIELKDLVPGLDCTKDPRLLNLVQSK